MTGLARVLDDVLTVVTTTEQDTSWTRRWDTADEMVRELSDHRDRVRLGDLSTLPELKFLFAPTGPLQDVSLSSGWGELFLRLAERFDGAYAEIMDS
ncbi:hypothetical protein [Actinocrispum wychmicini]|uniref:Uncharacterized protein n=1 Tax=Actinocrispum wychmicini TaxID=1213861 RepID=A0A4V2S8Z9_9PSEU|nr:hypothetical protein [Actinocrispum wychmicini]TCO65860.1 hypothetical protein EV192_1011652 [Actinocrispum wychmicini]